MKAKIHVTLKKTILDPQGLAVDRALRSLGYSNVEEVRLGKYIEIKLNQKSQKAARRDVAEMCEKLLANTVIEEYHFEVDEA